MKINKKLFRIIQSIVIITIFFIAFKELYKIFIDIDISLFKKYADKLTIVNLLIIAALPPNPTILETELAIQEYLYTFPIGKSIGMLFLVTKS